MYCTINDILNDLDRGTLLMLVNDENRLTEMPELEDGEEEPDVVDLADADDLCSVRITEQINSAGDEIDGYLRSRYPLPLITVPNLIKTICTEISIYNLYKRRHRLEMPDSIMSIYKSAVQKLKDIQKEIIDPGITVEEDAIVAKITVNKTDSDKLFSKDNLDRF